MKQPQNKPIMCSVHLRPLAGDISLLSLSAIFSKQSLPVILGANRSVERFSIFAAGPEDVFEVAAGEDDVFAKLQAVLGRYRLEWADCDIEGLPVPGWMGYFSYDLGRYIEKICDFARDDVGMPLVWLGFYDAMVVYDHQARQTYLIALNYPGQSQSVERRFARLESWIEQSQNIILKLPNGGGDTKLVIPQYRANMTKEDYFASLEKIHRHIIDGDVYQINFSQRFECPYSADPASLFLWQNTYNPSPFAAYLKANDWAIVSASPELFLQIDRRQILTRPIKGTRRRKMCECDIEATAYNQQQYNQLLCSEKDAAELMMIVDLERNDLARVCMPGTRYVKHQRIIEAYPTVFHAYSEIVGILPQNNDPKLFCEILKAVFPGGSITGAPKISAMEIIERLEPARRGVYTGCIGHIGLDFGVTLNIAIRTIVVKSGTAYIQTGGGIVADSNPDAEWDETLVKAQALLASIKGIDD